MGLGVGGSAAQISQGPRQWALGTWWPRRGTAQARHCGWRASERAARGLRRSLLGARPASSPLTWSAQVGPGRGAGLARRRGIRPRPCRRRRRELTWETLRGRGASARPRLATREARRGRQEAAAEEGLSRAATGATATRVAGAATCTWLWAPRGQSPRWPPLPAACPAHLPGKPATSRPGSRGPSVGQRAGRPRSCPRPVGRGLESGLQLLPLGRGRREYRSLLSPGAPRQP